MTNSSNARKTLTPDELTEYVERKIQQPPIVAHAISGMVGSLAAELLLFPVGKVKLLLQTAQAGEAGGVLQTFVRILRTEGLAGLYTGVHLSLLTESIHSTSYWLFHGVFFRHLTKGNDTSRTPTTVRFALNLLAKQLSWIVTVPLEVVTARNQLLPNNPGLLVTAAKVYSEGGLGTFYNGLAISMALAINPALMNTLITSLLRLLAGLRMLVLGQDRETAKDHGPGTVGSVTALSKFLATLVTYPLIRVKVLQQALGGAQAGIVGTLKSIVAAEGVIGLYRGMLAMSYKTVLWNTVMMMFKEVLGPPRVVTPAATPPRLDPASLVPPWMGREPFPSDLITAEKLDEILSALRLDRSKDKMQKIEGDMSRLSQEMAEIKDLLGKLVRGTGESRAQV